MRPDILNPLFAEVEVLKGIGPALRQAAEAARARPGRRHPLPSAGGLDRPQEGRAARRRRCRAGGDVAGDAGRLSPGRRARPVPGLSPPTATAIIVTLTYFNNPGWAKKQLPLGEPRIVSGRLERYGQELQIVHPDHVLDRRTRRPRLPEREPVYPLSEGLTNRRLRRSRRPGAGAAAGARRMDRAEPDRRSSGWPDWQEALAAAHREPRPAQRASGSLMTRSSPTSSP